MKRALSNWSRPPRELRRCATRLDNIALVPASQLGSLKQWQEYAARLPAGNTLIVIPDNNRHLDSVGHRICTSLRQRGRIAAMTSYHTTDTTDAVPSCMNAAPPLP